MKRCLTAILLLLPVLCLIAAPIKVIDTKTGLNTGATSTNRIVGQANFTNNAWIDCLNFHDVSIGIDIMRTGSAGNNSNVVYSFHKSINRKTYDPDPVLTLTVLATTSLTTLVTNLSYPGVPYLLLRTSTNNILATDYLTNTTVWANPKN